MTNSLIIDKSQSLVLKEAGSYEVTISGSKLELELEVLENLAVTLLVKTIGKDTDLDLQVKINDNAQLVTLFWNENEGIVNFKEETTILNNAFYQVVYGDLTGANLNYQSKYLLMKKGATVKANCALLANSKKAFDLKAQHFASYTNSDLENYGIVLANAEYDMTVTGHILKGSKQSVSHQTSRVLTIDKVEKCQVLPQLLIDENEVEASHAASIGQIDQEQLYYLQSRGLSGEAALRLIALGYLLPVAEVIEDPSLQKYLRDIITTKVAELCLT